MAIVTTGQTLAAKIAAVSVLTVPIAITAQEELPSLSLNLFSEIALNRAAVIDRIAYAVIGRREGCLINLQAPERRTIGIEHLALRGVYSRRLYPHPRRLLAGHPPLWDTQESRSTHTQDCPTPHSATLPIPSQHPLRAAVVAVALARVVVQERRAA